MIHYQCINTWNPNIPMDVAVETSFGPNQTAATVEPEIGPEKHMRLLTTLPKHSEKHLPRDIPELPFSSTRTFLGTLEVYTLSYISWTASPALSLSGTCRPGGFLCNT